MTEEGSSLGNKGKEKGKSKKSRYVIKLFPGTNAPGSSTQTPSNLPSPLPSPSSIVAPTPSPVIQPTQSPSPFVAPTHAPSSIVATTPSPVATTTRSPTSFVAPTQAPSVVVEPTRSPSPFIAVTPSPTATRVPSSSTSINGDDLDLGAEDPPPNDRPVIEPIGTGFEPSLIAAHAITQTIKQHFLHPWPTWGAMEDSDKDAFFQRFKRKVAWRLEDEEKIKKNFHSKAFHRLSDMFNEARKAGKRPLWVGEDVWNQLVAHWNSAAFRVKSTQASLNRASEKGGTLHTGGSITVHDHAKRMAKEFGRSVHIDEVFQQTHIRKETGQFVHERSSKTYEDFANKFSQAMSEAASSVDESHPMDSGLEDTIRSKCWSDAVGGITTKGRLYGAGDLARHLKDTQSSRVDVNLKRKASCSSSHDTEDIVQL